MTTHDLSQFLRSTVHTRCTLILSPRELLKGPFVHQLPSQPALHRVDDAVTEDRQKLPGMRRTTRCKVDARDVGMRRNKEVSCRSGADPVFLLANGGKN